MNMFSLDKKTIEDRFRKYCSNNLLFPWLLIVCLLPAFCWGWLPTEDELRAWCESLQWEQCEEMRQLLEQPEEAVVQWLGQPVNSDEDTPLHISARTGNAGLLQVWLLRAGQDRDRFWCVL